MHLLRRESNGEFSLTEYYGQPPPYAILSHTWGADSDEVTFKDIVKGRGKSKSGYEKLRFCAAQAEKDGLEYFWVDTCCIDKRDLVKLTEAINSMFSWYQHSAKCYVYLTDVMHSKSAADVPAATFSHEPTGFVDRFGDSWRAAFRKSKWFTRGWTLQELLAPSSVEFFDLNRVRLGDKHSLSVNIHQVTGICLQALQADPLSPSEFGIDERMSWAKGRNTKREEDAAYSLLGLFGVLMPLLYGEGRAKAFDRLHAEIQRTSALGNLRDAGVPAPYSEAPDNEIPSAQITTTSLKRRASNTFETTVTIPKVARRQAEADWEKERSVAMQNWWSDAINKHLDLPTGYEKVAVLLLQWSDGPDSYRIGDEVAELTKVFRQRFHFETETVELHHRSKPQHQMDRSLVTFIEKYDGPHNLLIVFYVGDSIRYTSARRLELVPSSDSSTDRDAFSGGRINWYKAEDMLRSDEVDGDVLAILDTAYASNSEIGHMANEDNDYRGGDEKNTRRFQLMGACDARTWGYGNHSFTRALVDALITLQEQNGRSSFSTQKLHQLIETNLGRSGTASLIWSLLPNKHNILLAPIVPAAPQTTRPLKFGRGYLRLGFELRDAYLEQEQIDYLARVLSSSLRNRLPIGLRRIDWLGFESHGSLSFTEHLSLARRVIHNWKRMVQTRKEMWRKQEFEVTDAEIEGEPSDWTAPLSPSGATSAEHGESSPNDSPEDSGSL